MIVRRGQVDAMLSLFERVRLVAGAHEAMWCVLVEDRRARGGPRMRPREPAMDVVRAAARAFGIAVPHLVYGGRDVAPSRWVVMRLLRDEGYSLRAIGKVLRVSPGTVLYGIDKANAFVVRRLRGELYERAAR